MLHISREPPPALRPPPAVVDRAKHILRSLPKLTAGMSPRDVFDLLGPANRIDPLYNKWMHNPRRIGSTLVYRIDPTPRRDRDVGEDEQVVYVDFDELRRVKAVRLVNLGDFGRDNSSQLYIWVNLGRSARPPLRNDEDISTTN